MIQNISFRRRNVPDRLTRVYPTLRALANLCSSNVAGLTLRAVPRIAEIFLVPPESLLVAKRKYLPPANLYKARHGTTAASNPSNLLQHRMANVWTIRPRILGYGVAKCTAIVYTCPLVYEQAPQRKMVSMGR